MQDKPSFIDIHTHQADQPSSSVYRVRNIIVDQDDVLDEACSVGIHPWYIRDDGTAQLVTLREMLQTNPAILAIGECGLDKVTEIDWQTQELVFATQLHLANEFAKPVIVHCVRAYQEVIQQVKAAKNTTPIIMHGFKKSKELADQLLQQGFYLSLGADILKGRQDQLISSIPLGRLFLETDDSDIPISQIYTYFCRVRNLSMDELQAQLWSNFEEVFN
ncbi:TatD family hydrolase [Sphingobacterium corticibacter]|uniref:TatD family hydrolase n=1 Tax=Sphingobacterium corticibacter TaxID=2171749 RepID=UPI0013FDD880|nr:TatD family hydrolase [Sphingobacterium corticibacter]